MADSDNNHVTYTNEHPTRLIANTYLVVGIAVLLIASQLETSTLGRYLIGTLVEFILAGLALLFMRFEKLPVARTGRLNIPVPRQILLAVAAAPGLWITGVFLNILSILVLGYVTPVPPSQFPTSLPEALALMLATMIAAPLCEELMFRGYVQRAYEKRNVRVGVVVSGMIFALYHLRFQGAAAIMPVALALAFLAWRTESIVPGIALHMAYNAIATVLLIATSFLPVQATGVLTGTLVCAGTLFLPASYAALLILWRNTNPSSPRSVPSPRRWVRWAWIIPLLGLAGVYAYAAVTEVLVGRFPEVVFGETIELDVPPAWPDQVSWSYRIQNQLGDQLGKATCSRTAEDRVYTLTCQADHAGYDLTDRFPLLGEVELPEFTWWPNGLPSVEQLIQADPESWAVTASWAKTNLAIRAFSAIEETPYSDSTQIRYNAVEGRPTVTIHAGENLDTLELPSDRTLMPYEWAWRLSALPFELAYAGDTSLVALSDPGTATVYEAFVNVQGGEPVWTPTGTFVAWKVSVTWQNSAGEETTQTAWYSSESPHTLIRFDDESVSYVLESVEITAQKPETGSYAVLLR